MSFSTKQVADMLGIAPQTLRFYERYGIDAGSRGEKGAVRSYSPAGVDELMSIRKYRNCGFTLANAAKALKSADQNEVADMLLKQSQEIEREIACKERIAQKLKEVAEQIRLCSDSLERVQTPVQMCCVLLDQDRRSSQNTIQILSEWSQWMPMAQWTLFISQDFEKRFYGFTIEAESAKTCGVRQEGCLRIADQNCIRMPVTWMAQKEELYDIVLPKLIELHSRYGAPAAWIRVQTLLNHVRGDDMISCGLIFYPIS